MDGDTIVNKAMLSTGQSSSQRLRGTAIQSGASQLTRCPGFRMTIKPMKRWTSSKESVYHISRST